MKSLDRGVVEKVRRVFVGAKQPALVDSHVQLQIQPRDVRFRADEGAIEAFEARRLQGEIMQPEHHLVDRRVVERARGIYRLDHHVKRDIAVVDRLYRRAADLGQITCKSRISRDVEPQGKTVHERADDLLQLRTASIRNRRANNNFVLGGQTVQHHPEAGEDGHEERGFMTLAELLQPRNHIRLDDTIDTATSE